jgi:hypothetical protein
MRSTAPKLIELIEKAICGEVSALDRLFCQRPDGHQPNGHDVPQMPAATFGARGVSD